MTTPKTAEEFARDLYIYADSHCPSLGEIEATLKAYLLKESAPLVEAMKRASLNIQSDILGEDEHPALTLENAIEAFHKKHGGVV